MESVPRSQEGGEHLTDSPAKRVITSVYLSSFLDTRLRRKAYALPRTTMDHLMRWDNRENKH